MKNMRLFTVLFSIVLMSSTSLMAAVSYNIWEKVTFFGSTKSEIQKAIGLPDEAGETDSYKITDSPDLVMMGAVEYANDKVAAVYIAMQPKITYEKCKELQLKSEEVSLITEGTKSALFAYKTPKDGGPRFVTITRPDDASTGPMIAELINQDEFQADEGMVDEGSTDSETINVQASMTQPVEAAPKYGDPLGRSDLMLIYKDITIDASLETRKTIQEKVSSGKFNTEGVFEAEGLAVWFDEAGGLSEIVFTPFNTNARTLRGVKLLMPEGEFLKAMPKGFNKKRVEMNMKYEWFCDIANNGWTFLFVINMDGEVDQIRLSKANG